MVEAIDDIAKQIYLNTQDRSEFTRLFNGTDSVENFEMKNKRKDGNIIWTSTTARAIRSEDGKLLYYEGFLQDITERKQAETALQQSEKQIRTLFDTVAEGIALNEIVYDENGEMVDYRILQVNPAFYSTADFQGQQVVGNVASELYGMSHESIKDFWKQHLPNNTTAYKEMLSPLNQRYFFVATSPFVDNKFVTTFFDITERKQAEKTVRDLARFPEENPNPILRVEIDGQITYANPAA